MTQFGKHFEKYKQLREAKGIAELTIESEERAHKLFWRFLEEQFPKVKNELEVQEQHLLAYFKLINSLETLKINTKTQRVNLLYTFYREAERQDWIIIDPSARIPKFKSEIISPRVLTVREIKQLLEIPDLKTVTGIRDRTIMELLYSTGLRSRELLFLKVAQIASDYKTLRVIGKGQKECVLPIGKMAAHFLAFYIDKIRPLIQIGKVPEVFISSTGKAFHEKALIKILDRHIKKLNPKGLVSPHTFRYSIATHLADEGVDIRIIQEFLRHESINTTARYIKQSYQKLQQVHHDTHPRERGELV